MAETSTELSLRGLRDILASEQSIEQFRAALPENVGVAKFTRALLTYANDKPDDVLAVYEQNPGSLFSALTKCASAGLLPDGRQAAINVYKTKVKRGGQDVWVPTAQFLPMIGGLRHILAQYGWTLETVAVRDKDEFSFTVQPPSIVHRTPPLGEERGDIVGAYAICTHRDGRRLQRVIDAARIAKSKAKARTDKVWNEWPEQMAEKTVGHDIFDDVPLDMEERERIRLLLRDDDAFVDPVHALYGTARAELPAGQAQAREDGGQPPAEAGTEHAEPHPQVPADPSFDFGEISPEPGGVGEDGGERETDGEAPPDTEPSPSAADWDPGDTTFDSGEYKGGSIRVVASSQHGRDWLLGLLLAPHVPKSNPVRMDVETFVRAEHPDLWKRYEEKERAREEALS